MRRSSIFRSLFCYQDRNIIMMPLLVTVFLVLPRMALNLPAEAVIFPYRYWDFGSHSAKSQQPTVQEVPYWYAENFVPDRTFEKTTELKHEETNVTDEIANNGQELSDSPNVRIAHFHESDADQSTEKKISIGRTLTDFIPKKHDANKREKSKEDSLLETRKMAPKGILLKGARYLDIKPTTVRDLPLYVKNLLKISSFPEKDHLNRNTYIAERENDTLSEKQGSESLVNTQSEASVLVDRPASDKAGKEILSHKNIPLHTASSLSFDENHAAKKLSDDGIQTTLSHSLIAVEPAENPSDYTPPSVTTDGSLVTKIEINRGTSDSDPKLKETASMETDSHKDVKEERNEEDDISETHRASAELETPQQIPETEPAHQSWLLYKSDEFLPEMFFHVADDELRNDKSPKNLENEKENEQLTHYRGSLQQDTSGPDLFPSSIFEEEVRVPFFSADY